MQNKSQIKQLICSKCGQMNYLLIGFIKQNGLVEIIVRCECGRVEKLSFEDLDKLSIDRRNANSFINTGKMFG